MTSSLPTDEETGEVTVTTLGAHWQSGTPPQASQPPQKCGSWDFPGGTVVKNALNWAYVPQMLKPELREPGLHEKHHRQEHRHWRTAPARRHERKPSHSNEGPEQQKQLSNKEYSKSEREESQDVWRCTLLAEIKSSQEQNFSSLQH